jgi:ADP-glucose type glycogen/starch synthase
MFHIEVARLISDELRVYKRKLPSDRIHLAEDRCFYYRDQVYGSFMWENPKIALAFQREVINNIIPSIKPDLIHCNDWMTGLIPAAARRQNIPCLITLHNIHTHDVTLEWIEESGIDAAEFWPYLYFKRVPQSYEESRSTNPVDLLASGIFAAHFINTVSPTFLREIVEGRHGVVPPQIRWEVANKVRAGCAEGILNSPDPSFDPAADKLIAARYDPDTHEKGKLKNKRALQLRTGLIRDDRAPLFFWPSRLDPIQKGCQLLTDILYEVVSTYWERNLQIVVVANGAYQKTFRDIVKMHNFYRRVAVCDFNEQLSHLAYAASDFLLIPSLFEPCGLPQMTSALYGSLPIAHDTGGLHDTVARLDVEADTGNGFPFETHDSNGLRWAIGEAMKFDALPREVRSAQVTRVMRESAARFRHSVTAERYFRLYEAMLKRPIINPF